MTTNSSPVVEPQSVVRLGVALRDDAGNALQTDITQLEVIVGFGQLLPQVEQPILGLHVGQRCELKLQPAEAFGEYDPDKQIEIDREEFPPDVAPGDLFDAEREGGTVTTLTLLEVHEDYVLVDLNHVLAGKCVTIDFEVLAIRPASKRELEVAAMARENADSESDQDLLPLNRLLRGRSQR